MAIWRNEAERRLVWTEANIQALLVQAFFVSTRSRVTGFAVNMRYELSIFEHDAEADLLLVKPSGRVTEFEIKLTRADFLADLRHKPDKHRRLAAAYADPTVEPPFAIPNELSYVVPATLNIAVSDVPNYAGLVIVYAGGRIGTVKRAPVIHKHKFEALSNLTTPLSWRLAKGMQVVYEMEQTAATPTS